MSEILYLDYSNIQYDESKTTSGFFSRIDASFIVMNILSIILFFVFTIIHFWACSKSLNNPDYKVLWTIGTFVYLCVLIYTYYEYISYMKNSLINKYIENVKEIYNTKKTILESPEFKNFIGDMFTNIPNIFFVFSTLFMAFYQLLIFYTFISNNPTFEESIKIF